MALRVDGEDMLKGLPFSKMNRRWRVSAQFSLNSSLSEVCGDGWKGITSCWSACKTTGLTESAIILLPKPPLQ